MLNASLHGLAGWVDVKPAVVSTAVSAYQGAYAAMRPAAECNANRDECAIDNAINPWVLGMLTPRIGSLDVEYYGVMWPTNAAAGASMGAVFSALAASLAIPPPPATMGASPAAPAAAASAVGESAAEAGVGDGMRAAHTGVSTAGSGAKQGSSAAEGVGGRLNSMMEPMQSLLGAAPQALQAPSGVGQAPSSLMGPAQSMMGMFTNPGAMAGPGSGASSMSGSMSAASAAVAGEASGGSVAGGGMSAGGVPATSFTRPVSAFESAPAGRPVGLRPSAALGAEELRTPVTTTSGGAGMGGMPVGAAGAGQRGSDRRPARTTVAHVVDNRA
jgi:PPE-repeat protein